MGTFTFINYKSRKTLFFFERDFERGWISIYRLIHYVLVSLFLIKKFFLIRHNRFATFRSFLFSRGHFKLVYSKLVCVQFNSTVCLKQKNIVFHLLLILKILTNLLISWCVLILRKTFQTKHLKR